MCERRWCILLPISSRYMWLFVFSRNTIGADAVRTPERPFLFIFFALYLRKRVRVTLCSAASIAVNQSNQ
jgi:hypothetical protein